MTPEVPILTELSDRREALRLPTIPVDIIVEHHVYGRHPAVIADISRRGIRFQSESFLPCGSTVLIYPPSGIDLRPSWVRIVRQKVIDLDQTTLFDYGVQFTDDAEIRRHSWFLALRNTEMLVMRGG